MRVNVKGGELLIRFSNCGIDRVKVYVLMGCIRTILKEGRVKVEWATLTEHFLVFRCLSIAQLSVLKQTIKHPQLRVNVAFFLPLTLLYRCVETPGPSLQCFILMLSNLHRVEWSSL